MTNELVLNVENELPVGGEFQGHNGDCVEYALMVAKKAKNKNAPCNGVELERLTVNAIDDNEASSSGAMTNAELAWLCNFDSCRYNQLTTGDLVSLCQTFLAQGYPVCMGFSNGQALPGNEQNVFGHCVTFLNWNGTYFTVANGDSTNGRNGQLDLVTVAEVENARPTQVTAILEANVSGPYDGYYAQTSPTNWTLDKNPSLHVQDAILTYYRSVGEVVRLVTSNENYDLRAEIGDDVFAIQAFEGGYIAYDPNRKFDNPPTPGPCYLVHVNDPRVEKLFHVGVPAGGVLKLGVPNVTATEVVIPYTTE